MPVLMEGYHISGVEEEVIRYYERFWLKFAVWWASNETLAIHLGYHDEGIRSHKDAILNMNDYAWNLLECPANTPIHILDAGCGVGGTSIYLAKKYPTVSFTGITIVPSQVKMAAQYAERHRVNTNTYFVKENYCETSFPDNYFDGIIALESINYSRDKKEFLGEMYRVLKPSRRLVVLDGFLKKNPWNPLLQKIYEIWLAGRALKELECIDEILVDMEHQGFHDIIGTDISRHVARSFCRGAVIGVPFFCSALCKRIMTLNLYNNPEDVDYFMGISILGGILALSDLSSYYAVSAIK